MKSITKLLISAIIFAVLTLLMGLFTLMDIHFWTGGWISLPFIVLICVFGVIFIILIARWILLFVRQKKTGTQLKVDNANYSQ